MQKKFWIWKVHMMKFSAFVSLIVIVAGEMCIFFYFLCLCFLSLFLLPSKKFTCWQIPAIVPGWLWQLWAACCLPQRQLDQLPRPHNAMNGIKQDVQMMVMITIISISSKQLVYQSDPDPTQLMNLNKTIWTQLRYSLLWSWKMRKVALQSFSSWIIQGCYMCFVRVEAISFAADAHLTKMTMGLTSLWYPIFNEWSPLRPDQWWPWVASTNNSIGRALL